MAQNNNNSTASNNNTQSSSSQVDDYKEGTVNLICADSIAHEILLPPSVLAHEDEDNDGDDEDEDDNNDNDNDDDDDDDDSSKIAYIVQPKDSVYPQIISIFEGHDILMKDNRRIDRLKLGSIVFKDPQRRRQLNSITHPKILLILIQQLLRGVFLGNCDITVADIPLLFESGKLNWLFAVTICVTTNGSGSGSDDDDGSSSTLQLERLQKRNPNLSKAECQARIDSQLPLSQKEKMADIVIDNTGSLEQLSEQVEEVRKDLMGRLYGIGMSLLQMLLLIGGSTSIAVSSKFYTHWQQ
jgi:dephospho-CoA kinase